MRARVLIVLAALVAAPALAQPIIIPLKEGSGNPREPAPSAPPVAPPQAGPSMPADNVASQPQTPTDDGQHVEEANQAPATPPR